MDRLRIQRQQLDLSPQWTAADNAQLQELLQRVTGRMPDIPDPEFIMVSHPGAMTDAPKRRAADVTEGAAMDMKPKIAPPVKSAPPTGLIPAAYSSREAPVAMTSPAENNQDVDLPEAILSLSDWGDTVFTNGKLKDRDLTYADVRLSPDAEAVSYVQWTLAHGAK